jgi:hypothetical protein
MVDPGAEKKGEYKKCSNDQVIPLLAYSVDGGYKDNREKEIKKIAEPCETLKERT